jgi:hypothetical protein
MLSRLPRPTIGHLLALLCYQLANIGTLSAKLNFFGKISTGWNQMPVNTTRTRATGAHLSAFWSPESLTTCINLSSRPQRRDLQSLSAGAASQREGMMPPDPDSGDQERGETKIGNLRTAGDPAPAQLHLRRAIYTRLSPPRISQHESQECLHAVRCRSLRP